MKAFRYRRASRETIGDLFEEFAPNGTIVLDVEPLLVGWRQSNASLNAEIKRLTALFPAAHILMCTNSSRYRSDSFANGVQLLSRARKPFTSVKLFDDSLPLAAVIGDTLVTDGMLAWRLDIPFIWIDVPLAFDPIIVLERLAGAVLLGLIKLLRMA